MRILHVTSYFPPDRLGGVGEVVANIHRELGSRGHHSIVLTSGTPHDEPGIIRIARSPTGFALGVARHVALTRQANVIHMHHGEGLGLLAMQRMLGIRTPVLVTFHTSISSLRASMNSFDFDDQHLGRAASADARMRTIALRVREWMDACALPLSDRQNFVSRRAAIDLLGPIVGATARVIYNGVPPAHSLAADADPVELLYVGAHGPWKRVQLLPLILARIRLRRPGTRLRVVGFAAQDHPELLKLSLDLGVSDAIIFEGRVRSSELPKFYRAAEVLLIPSAYEGMPMVMLEAMQHGLPCVATRVGGHPEVIDDGKNGFLVEPDRPDLMADAALRLLEDGRLSETMRQHAAETIEERFTVKRQIDEYISLYEEMIA